MVPIPGVVRNPIVNRSRSTNGREMSNWMIVLPPKISIGMPWLGSSKLRAVMPFSLKISISASLKTLFQSSPQP